MKSLFARCMALEKINAVNELRFQQFCLRSSLPAQLPPTKDALRKHILRANYQACIWRRCLESRPAVPSPHEHGWLVEGDVISIDWMDSRPAPEELLVLTKCSCQQGCATLRCSCKKAQMPCTDACKCAENCSNKPQLGRDDGDEGDDQAPAESQLFQDDLSNSGDDGADEDDEDTTA